MAEGDKKPFIKLYWSLWDDKRLSGNEKLVLISLLRHYNMEKRRSWPSLNTIAEECVCSRVVVWQTLKTLETKGFIKCEKTAGKVTQYELIFDGIPVQNFNGYTHSESEPVEHVTHSESEPVSNIPIQNLNGGYSESERVPIQNLNTTHSESEPVSNIPIQNLNGGYSESERVPIQNLNTTHSESEPELYLRTRSIRTRSIELEKPQNPRGDFSADFEEFWKAYPKPKNPDKTPTRKKYEALRKKGVSGDDLLKAAQGYARSTQGTDPRYIKHGATFLGPQEPWRDYLTEPEPVSDEPPDAEKLFPDLAEWMRRNRGVANGE